MNARLLCRSAIVCTVAAASSSCRVRDDIKEATDNAVAALQDGINKLTSSLSSWQQVLQDVQRKLTADAQSTIRNEVTSLLQGSIALANASFQCDVDFIGHRVLQSLRRMVSRLKKETTDETLEPSSCSAVPAGVEYLAWRNGRVPKLDIFGYDFDAGELSLWLIAGGNRTDISTRMAKISQYQLAVNLGGEPALLSGAPQEIHLVWKQDFNHAVSEVPILLPVTPVCIGQSKTIPEIPDIEFHPRKVAGGDNDFGGNGPEILTSVNLSVVGGSTLQASIYMRARETRSDWTEARGSAIQPVYHSDPGWRIDNVLTPAYAFVYYRDTNHDTETRYPGGPVTKMEVIGDTKGDDIGETGVKVDFSSVNVYEIQDRDCIAPSTAHALIASGRVSDPQRLRLEGALRTLPPEAFHHPFR